jgi:hypothetical protein
VSGDNGYHLNAGVTHPLVAKIRKVAIQVETVSTSTTRTIAPGRLGKDGKRYPARRGKPAALLAAEKEHPDTFF